MSFLWIDMLMVRSLNPFLRMDGFWLLTDLVGSAGLWQEFESELRGLVRRVRDRRRPTAHIPFGARVFIIAYGVVALAVFVSLYTYVARLIVTDVLARAPLRLRALLDAVMTASWGEVASGVGTLLWHAMLVATVVATLLELIRRLGRLVR